jgi:hypothetical protein
MARVFGIIAEGPSDIAVIRNILIGYFSDPDLELTEIQPVKKQPSGEYEPGGWNQVLSCCASDRVRGAFQYNDAVIIQIDTDVSEEKGYDVPKRDADGRELTPEKLVQRVEEKLSSLIGPEVMDKFADRILFAVCVHELECWLLPLYYKDNKKSKIAGCLPTLNQALGRKEGFTINVNKKNHRYYEAISEPYRKKRKVLMDAAQHNASFKVFVDRLGERFAQP